MKEKNSVNSVIENLEKDLREFFEKIGGCISWNRFISLMPPSVKEMLIEEWVMLNFNEGKKVVCEFLERYQYYNTLGHFLESLYGSAYYSPGIVKAAEAYEKACNWENALRLYKEGIEKCDPSRVMVYDEKTGGYVSADSYPKLNRELLEEAENLVKKCKEKIKECEEKLKYVKFLKSRINRNVKKKNKKIRLERK